MSGPKVEVQIAGLKELAAGLKELPAELEKRGIYAALSGAGKVVKDAAVEAAPVLKEPVPHRKAGTVQRAIRVSRSKINKGQHGLYQVIVRVKPLNKRQRTKFKQGGGAGRDNPDDPFYWWFLEFGTSKMPARPFMRRAFETTKEQQLAAIRTRMAAAIKRAAAKIKQEVDRGARK